MESCDFLDFDNDMEDDDDEGTDVDDDCTDIDYDETTRNHRGMFFMQQTQFAR